MGETSTEIGHDGEHSHNYMATRPMVINRRSMSVFRLISVALSRSMPKAVTIPIKVN